MTDGGARVAQMEYVPVLDRALASSEDREAWLAARRFRVTATEAAGLRRKGAAFRRDLLAAKVAGTTKDLAGNRYVERGNAREPAIAAWVSERWPHLRGNTVLFHAPQQSRHAATPDLLGVREGVHPGTLACEVGEIKTSKHDLNPWAVGGYFQGSGYWEQMQWQMYVAGASRCLFVWEQHDDQWPDPQPLSLEPEYAWVERDDAEVAALVTEADRFLAELDLALAEDAPRVTTSSETDLLGLAVLSTRADAALAKAAADTAWKRLLTHVAGRPSFSESGASRVTWTNDTKHERVPDVDAALATDEGRRLYEAANAARLAWEQFQAKHSREREVAVQRLTVTAVKAKGGE